MIKRMKRWFENRHQEKMERGDKAHRRLSELCDRMDRIERKRKENLDFIWERSEEARRLLKEGAVTNMPDIEVRIIPKCLKCDKDLIEVKHESLKDMPKKVWKCELCDELYS